MNIKPFLKQTATYQARTQTHTAWGDASYEPPVQIKVRRTQKMKTVRKQNEWRTLLMTQYMTAHNVKPGDRIDGEEIWAVEDLRGLDGKLIGTICHPNAPPTFGND